MKQSGSYCAPAMRAMCAGDQGVCPGQVPMPPHGGSGPRPGRTQLGRARMHTYVGVPALRWNASPASCSSTGCCEGVCDIAQEYIHPRTGSCHGVLHNGGVSSLFRKSVKARTGSPTKRTRKGRGVAALAESTISHTNYAVENCVEGAEENLAQILKGGTRRGDPSGLGLKIQLAFATSYTRWCNSTVMRVMPELEVPGPSPVEDVSRKAPSCRLGCL